MTKILNIDDLVEEAPLVIEMRGKKHEMKPSTMGDFIANMKDLESLSAAPGVVAETEITVRIILRAFPTLTEADVMSWPTAAIGRIFDIVRGIDPDAQVEAKDDEGNGSSAS